MDIDKVHNNIEDELFCDFLINRNKESFERLFKMTKPWLYRLINKLVADSDASVDIIQNVWIKIINGKHKFDPEKGKLKNYLFTIAKNEALQWKSTNKKHEHSNLDDAENNHAGAVRENGNPENILELAEKSKIIRNAIQKLPENYQDVVMLFYFSDMKVNEIAELLSIPDGTVKIWLSRARGKLEIMLTKMHKKGILQTYIFCLSI